MCGISGYFSESTSKEKIIEIITSMTQIQHHRGPDYSGYYFDGSLGLGHNRLSLLDLNERSNQPFVSGQYVLVFNGEIYNYQELRAQLEQNDDVIFQTTSDTEVLQEALIHWGVDTTLKRLNGMFAFAFFDKINQTISLARDRIGIKPLFYAISDNRLVFASEVKAICCGAGMNQPRQDLLNQAPFGLYEFSRIYTAFKDVFQLEPGTYLQYQLKTNKHKITRYFKTVDFVDFNYFEELLKSNQNQVLERFEHLFKNAIKSMVLADAPMGAFVSGGVDSSLIASLALKIRDLKLYSSDVVGVFSELEETKLLAKYLGKDLIYDSFHPNCFLNDWVKATWHNESPIVVHTNAVPFQRVSELAFSQKDKAVLTGEGSDELFLGYPRLLTKKYDKLITFPITLIEKMYKKIPGLTRYLNLNKDNYPKNIERQVTSYEKELLELNYKESFAFLKNSKSKDLQMQTLRMIDNGLHSLLWRNDRMGMMHGIESRFPFLDEEVMRFAVNLPAKFKIANTLRFHNWKHPFLMDKAIVRKLALKFLPPEKAYKQKQGFPMYGHMFMNIDYKFFINGFWQHAFGMSETAISYMGKNTDPYLLAKLASVEIWGSLFNLNQSINEVEMRVKSHIKMNI